MPAAIEFDTARLRLRTWQEQDREPFAALNADPQVMAYFPALTSRAASDASIDAWTLQFAERGWSNWAVEHRATQTFIGFVGLSVPKRLLPFSPCVEIGWRLARAHWGRGLATEAAQGVLRVGFEQLALPEIVSFTAVGNLRSRAVMERLGLRNAQADFDHPGVPEGHALRRHCLYRIDAAMWRRYQAIELASRSVFRSTQIHPDPPSRLDRTGNRPHALQHGNLQPAATRRTDPRGGPG